MAPVAPEIIPGLPPKSAVTIPIINAPYKPTNGSIPATKAKATASGTSARATVNPERISFFGFCVKFFKVFCNMAFRLKSGKDRNLDGREVWCDYLFFCLLISLKRCLDLNFKIVVAHRIPDSIAPATPTSVISCPTNFNPLILVLGRKNGSEKRSGVCAKP